ncbi:MAG: CPBP family intramembrane metalloprotease [Phycisphaerae bacterium]|nr:CPBP family intramembrane metalloprotease [Phycisphaerae bacterium]NUQ46977.1 CPBP family intramembrane metalloprotease [Phycisphaerae bacterium]
MAALPDSTYPSLRQSLILLLLLIGLTIVLSVMNAVADVALGTRLAFDPFHLGLINLIAFLTIVSYGVRRTGQSARAVLALRPVRAILFLPLIPACIGLNFLLSEADNVLRSVLPMPSGFAETYLHVVGPHVPAWKLLFTLSFVAPLTEEFLFRGLLMHGYLQRYTARRAIVISALLFGVVHLNPWQFASATVLGLLVGWCRVRTGSLWLCLFVHALNNSIVSLIQVIPGLEIPGYTVGSIHESQFQPLWFNALGVGLTAAGLGSLAWLFRQLSPVAAARPVPMAAPAVIATMATPVDADSVVAGQSEQS